LINIIFEDNDILVCEKQAGMAVQSKNISVPDMESELRNRLKRSGQKGDIHVIHRLDQPVEGIIVFAKNRKAAASLGDQIKSGGGMHKTYLAVTAGFFPSEQKEGELRDYLKKDPASKCAVIADAADKEAKEALLSYSVIEEKEVDGFNISLLRIKLQTGRYHQIRAQLSSQDYPILGDRRYGSDQSREISERLGVRNVALCAAGVKFRHPANGRDMEFDITPKEKIFREFAGIY
jgi:23S rRNA pseudouridine1911/1915/1917 synthase